MQRVNRHHEELGVEDDTYGLSSALSPKTPAVQGRSFHALKGPAPALRIETSDDKKVEQVDEKVEFELPPKQGTRLSRYIQYDFFTTYRKLFAFVFTCNAFIFIFTLISLNAKNMVITSQTISNLVSFNILVTSLFRQENFVNMLYEIAVGICPLSAPLFIRRRLAKVFHYGGVHAAAGTCAVLWFLLYTAVATMEVQHDRSMFWISSIVTSYLLVLLFAVILIHAHPYMRVKYHDHFEQTHRFCAWSALILFWLHNIFAAIEHADSNEIDRKTYIIRQPYFWFLIVSTSCTLLSWSRLRKREVTAEPLDGKRAVILHFNHKTMPPFYGVKLSDRPVFEGHSFATLRFGETGYSVIVAAAGDWTSKIVQNPPTHLWIRGSPQHGLLYTSKLFKRIVVIGTGSGIGPCLSLMFAKATPCRVFWSVASPLETYGEKVYKMCLEADKNAIIWDTKKQGRPDLLGTAYRLYRESDAEAVFIISSPKLTRLVVRGLSIRGIPAYGAIFDS